MLRLFNIILCLQYIARAEGSSFATYSDSECSTVVQNVAAHNAYPSGSCTKFEQQTTGSFQSFMFLTMDDGCGLTVYTPNTDERPCSGLAVVGELNKCYNTSWPYYSVDNCDVPTILSTTLSTSTAGTAATATNTPTSAPSTTSGITGGPALSAGEVVGISLSCVAGTALIMLALGWSFLRRKVRRDEGDARPGKPALHATGGYGHTEMATSATNSQSFPTGGGGTTSAHIYEVPEQCVVEAGYNAHFPVAASTNAEMYGVVPPGELPAQEHT